MSVYPFCIDEFIHFKMICATLVDSDAGGPFLKGILQICHTIFSIIKSLPFNNHIIRAKILTVYGLNHQILSLSRRLSPNRSREGSAQINCVCVCVCVFVRHPLNAYISETI